MTAAPEKTSPSPSATHSRLKLLYDAVAKRHVDGDGIPMETWEEMADADKDVFAAAIDEVFPVSETGQKMSVEARDLIFDTMGSALAYIQHVGANHVMRGERHPQEWLVENLQSSMKIFMKETSPSATLRTCPNCDTEQKPSWQCFNCGCNTPL